MRYQPYSFLTKIIYPPTPVGFTLRHLDAYKLEKCLAAHALKDHRASRRANTEYS
jgi:hypothetical protein